MKKQLLKNFVLFNSLVLSLMLSSNLSAAISLDRTRVIFDGGQKSVSINIENKNTQLPYLAQGWIENSEGEKVTSPFVVLPPIQRIEPSKTSQVRIEALPAVNNLPQDRESLYYFNLREIPPKSDTPNVLQLALQSKIKLFYRPKTLSQQYNDKVASPWQNQLVLLKQNNDLTIKNPTPFYITISSIAEQKNSAASKSFQPVMVAPFSDVLVKNQAIGMQPVVTYINDYGGNNSVAFKCQSNTCTAIETIK